MLKRSKGRLIECCFAAFAVVGCGGDSTSTEATSPHLAPTTPTEKGDWSRAGEWSTYQGNNRHTGFVDATIDTAAIRVKWVATPLASSGYYQPTLGGGRIYLAADVRQSRVLAVNPVDGSVIWSRNFGTSFGINQVTYDKGALYVASGGQRDTYMWGLDAVDGSVRFQAPFLSQFSHWKAPVVVGSTVVAAGGYYGGMYGFSTQTGEQLFFRTGAQVDNWGPAAANGMVYWVNEGSIEAVNPTDGKSAFSVPESRARVTTPVIGDANDVLTAAFEGIISTDLTTRTTKWVAGSDMDAGFVVGNGVVYAAANQRVEARRESDGSVLWSWNTPSQLPNIWRLVGTNNVLFVQLYNAGLSCETHAVSLSSHLSIWTYPACGEMAISQAGVLYITSGDKLVAVTLR